MNSDLVVCHKSGGYVLAPQGGGYVTQSAGDVSPPPGVSLAPSAVPPPPTPKPALDVFRGRRGGDDRAPLVKKTPLPFDPWASHKRGSTL